MTVKQLIAKLQKLPPSLRVVVAKHSGEGSPLDSLGEGHYEPDSTWSGSLVHPDDVADRPKAFRCVVLEPVN